MTAVLHRHVDASHVAPYDYALDCMAGFFVDEAQAREAAHQLQLQHSLQARQSLLIGPAQAAWLPFRRQLRSWDTSRHSDRRSMLSDAPLMATLGGVVALLAVMIWLVFDGVPDGGEVALLLSLGALAGTIAGWASSTLSAGSSRYRRFNRNIRRQLAAGRWVVLAREVPWPQQAGAAALLRERAVGWCAVSAPWQQL